MACYRAGENGATTKTPGEVRGKVASQVIQILIKRTSNKILQCSPKNMPRAHTSIYFDFSNIYFTFATQMKRVVTISSQVTPP